MTWAMVGAAAISTVGGIFGGKSAKKLQKESLALQREELAFNKQRYTDYQDQYGGLADLVVSEAEKGVQADLGRASSEANADTATAFANSKQALDNQNQRMGINPNSGRADSTNRQLSLNQAVATAGNVTNARNNERQFADDATWNRRYGVYQQGNTLITGAANAVNGTTSSMATNQSNAATAASQSSSAAIANGASLATQSFLNNPNAINQLKNAFTNTTTTPVSSIDSATKGMKVNGTQVGNGVVYDNISSVRPPQQAVNNGSFLG